MAWLCVCCVCMCACCCCVISLCQSYCADVPDETCTEQWDGARLSGKFYGWPGAWGKEPLVIPSDRVVVCFRSGAVAPAMTSAGASSAALWGVKLLASAPVSAVGHRRLMDLWAGIETAAHPPNPTVCSKLLALYNNDVAEAGACVWGPSRVRPVVTCCVPLLPLLQRRSCASLWAAALMT